MNGTARDHSQKPMYVKLPKPPDTIAGCIQRIYFPAFANKPEVGVLIVLGALMFLISAASGWWRLAGQIEPRLLVGFRACALCLAIISIVALIDLQRRAKLLYLCAALGVLIPITFLIVVPTADAPLASSAVVQLNEINRIETGFDTTDFALGAGWYNDRTVVPSNILRNDYDLTDGLETTAFYCKVGWFLCLGAGLISLLCLWGWNGDQARKYIAQYRPVLVWLIVLFLLGDYGRLLVGYGYWYAARRDASVGSSQNALDDYQNAEKWDPRYSYDIMTSYNVGRLEGALGNRQAQDYWAMIGDTWSSAKTSNNAPYEAYMMYRNHVVHPAESLELVQRYANTAYAYGAHIYLSSPETALAAWEDGHRVNPNNLELIFAISLALTKSHEYPMAIVYWRQFISDVEGIGIFKSKFATSTKYITPMIARAWSALAWCYFNEGQYDTARQCMFLSTQVNQVDPDTVTAQQAGNGN